MASLRRLCLLSVFFFLIGSCTRQNKDPIVLKVGSKVWKLKSFRNSLDLELQTLSSIEKRSPLDFQKIKQELIQNLILKALLENWAKKNKVAGSRFEKTSKKDFDSLTKKIPLKNFQQQQKQKFLHESLLEHLSKQIPKPSLSKQKAYYQKNKKSFRKAPSCFLEHILVASESLAKKLLLQIKAGDSFKSLKFLHSLKPDIGWIERGVLDTFDKACQLRIDSLSPVLKSPYGYHIFKVLKKRKVLQKTFPQAQKEILQALLKKPKQKAFKVWLKTEISKNSVFINKNLLDKIHIQYKKNEL